MAARDVRKNCNAFIDGRGYAGQVDEFNAPSLTLQTEDFRAGGMDAPLKIVMGMEGLESDLTLKGYDRSVLALFGVKQGLQVPVTYLEALESFDGTTTQVKHNLRGVITKIEPGTSKPGEMAGLKLTFALSYYKMTHGGVVVHEIDVERMIRTINGVDALAGIRAALNM